MKVDRLIAIIMVLMERDIIGASELAEMFEVSLRTIYRDIEAIGKTGVPIISSTGPGGGIGIMDSYKMEKRLFSASDITALLMGLGHIQSSLPSGRPVNTLAKVRGVIPDDEYRKLEIRASQIKIDMKPWHGKERLPQNLESIRLALDKQRIIRFHYRTGKNEESTREVEPCRLLLKDMDWYLQGYCRKRQDYRTFKLSRMQEVCLLDETYELKEIPVELDNFNFDNDVNEVIKLKIDSSLWEVMAGYFGEDNIESDNDGHYLVTAYMPVEEATARFLIGFCNHCVCLEPAKMRNLIKIMLAKTAELYQEK